MIIRFILKTVFLLFSLKKIDGRLAVFADERLSALPKNMLFLYNELKRRGKYDIRVILPREKKSGAFSRLAGMLRFTALFAHAKYIIVEDYYYPLYVNKRRDGTSVLQLWHACGPFKRFGYQCVDTEFGMDHGFIKKFPIHTNYTHIPVCSPDSVPYFRDAFNIRENADHVFLPAGVPRTDIYFREDFKKRSVRKLQGLFPGINGRKVILYAPTFRGEITDAKFEGMIDIDRFREALGRDYVLITKLHPFIRNTVIGSGGARDFYRDVTGSMGIEEALCTADICISDYSSLIFEYALFERPMIFYVYDFEAYMKYRGTYYNYESFIPGKMVRMEDELIAAIQSVGEWFEPGKVRAFKEKYMRCCDGQSTKRITDLFFS